MKVLHILKSVVRVAAVICALMAQVLIVHAETRVALVVGNATYATSPLKNPRADAALMSRTLVAAGFDVMTIMDGDAEALRAALNEFSRRLQVKDAVAVFYYAGHGVQSGGDNYLIPVGARLQGTDDLDLEAIPLGAVFRAIEKAGSETNIIILDACRDNPIDADDGRGWRRGLATVVAPAGTLIAYATGPGQIARDGSGANSPYTAALATAMAVPGATLEDVFRSARRDVLAVTARQQTPWEHSSLVTRFQFLAKPANDVAAIPLGVIGSDAQHNEIIAWQKIRYSVRAGDYATHLQAYPAGLFFDVAAVRIGQLQSIALQTPGSISVSSFALPARDAATAQAAYAQAMTLSSRDATLADLQRAAALFTFAAAGGVADAMYRLGRAYDKGLGVSKDALQAARWYQLAADAGHTTAMASLGTMFEYGEGVAANLTEAVRLYKLASEAGDVNGTANLAYLYSQGKGVARNAIEARRLYEIAVAQKHTRAAFNLALMLAAGEGGPVNEVRAVALLHVADRQRYPAALLELAHFADKGRGMRRDVSKAADYFLQAVAASANDGRRFDATLAPKSFAARREIQKRLAMRGLYDGIATGIFNAGTRRGIVALSDK